MPRNLPEKWDNEYDLIANGSSAGGLSASITAHDLGSSALVIEKSDQVGGVTALSKGEVWVAANHLAGGVEADEPA
jgi:3-oxosteroid 1-dehydrogenase